MTAPLIALAGDYSPQVPAHRAIPPALELARQVTGIDVAWRWIHSSELREPGQDLADFAALWAVPASPYTNMDGVLKAIGWARENRRPFLGTCGGFQHALIEFARSVAGLTAADHAETNPQAHTLVVTPLSCSLLEKSGRVHFTKGSAIQTAYGCDTATESYHCSYGVNPVHRAALELAGMQFTALDDAGDVRGLELPEHPFFVGTLFQPERNALRGEAAPLVNAFVRSIAA